MDSGKRLVLAIALGNMLLWYDIALFSFFAAYISNAFFPYLPPDVALLVTFGTFAVSFIARPIGALLLGSYADRVGRRQSLLISTTLMTVGTFMVATMPTYAQVGVCAPLGILFARILQGLAAGGEFGSATAALAEAEPSRRGLAASWQLASQTISGALAAAAGLVLSLALEPAEIQAWGWRLPFAFGLVVGPVGLYVRSQMTPGLPAAEPEAAPVRKLMHSQWHLVAIGIGLVVISTSVTYMLAYIPVYATRTLGLSSALANTAVLLGFLVQFPITLMAGRWSDALGRARIMSVALTILVISLWPVFSLLTTTREPLVVIGSVLWLAALKAVYAGPLPALLSDLFPTATRASGIAIAYNSAVALFGGTAAITMSWLILAYGSAMAPALYLLLGTIVSGLALATHTRNQNRLQRD